MTFEKGTKLKHYKGGLYTVIAVATESETGNEVIVYQNDADKRIWVRPIDMFYEDVYYKFESVARFIVIEGENH